MEGQPTPTSTSLMEWNVAGVVGFKGQIGFDTSRPDGTPRKLLDVRRLTALGWQAHTGLKEGIASTYQWLDHELASFNRPRGFSERPKPGTQTPSNGS